MSNPRIQGLTLVHGLPVIARGRHKLRRYGHAWLELQLASETWVVDYSQQTVLIPREVYYKLGNIRVRQCVRYSLQEASCASKEFGHSGPWHEHPKSTLFKRG